jgi:hypothetical protein
MVIKAAKNRAGYRLCINEACGHRETIKKEDDDG